MLMQQIILVLKVLFGNKKGDAQATFQMLLGHLNKLNEEHSATRRQLENLKVDYNRQTEDLSDAVNKAYRYKSALTDRVLRDTNILVEEKGLARKCRVKAIKMVKERLDLGMSEAVIIVDDYLAKHDKCIRDRQEADKRHMAEMFGRVN